MIAIMSMQKAKSSVYVTIQPPPFPGRSPSAVSGVPLGMMPRKSIAFSAECATSFGLTEGILLPILAGGFY